MFAILPLEPSDAGTRGSGRGRRIGRVHYFREPFSPQESAVLEQFFTNTDLPVFALINLPEVVKGALFARYSRTSKSIRRLFLDEFIDDPETGIGAIADRLTDSDPLVNMRRAEDLYQRVFFEYGDDSVAQLGGTHLACEQASNLLTKVLEWGRLAAYLEQSTRYIYYDKPLGDRYRYQTPPEISSVRAAPRSTSSTPTGLFTTYARIVAEMREVYERRFPRSGRRLPRRVQRHDQSQGLRCSQGPAPRFDDVQCRHLRQRAGVRAVAHPNDGQPAG